MNKINANSNAASPPSSIRLPFRIGGAVAALVLFCSGILCVAKFIGSTDVLAFLFSVATAAIGAYIGHVTLTGRLALRSYQ